MATTSERYRSVRVHRIAWTSNGSGAATVTADDVDGEILRVCFVQGAATPTTLYDVTLTDVDGLDVLQGVGANIDSSSDSQVTPLIGDGTTTDKLVGVSGDLTLNVTNAGNTKDGTVVLYVR